MSAIDPLTEALGATVEAAVERALANHRPRYAVSYAEAAQRLSCSTRQIGLLVAEGELETVPHTRSISLGSLRRLAGLEDLPLTGTGFLSVIGSEAIDEVAS